MPLQNAAARANLTFRCYPSGHMVYLDGNSRTALKADLASLYDRATHAVAARLFRMAAAMRSIRAPIHPYFKLERPAGAIRPAAAGSRAWEVADLCAAYSWPAGLAGGGAIALLEFGGGWLQSDIDAYFGRTKLPPPTVVDVPLGAGGNAPNPGGDPFSNPDGEVALDIQVAAAAYSVATGKPATIRVYWADASDWGSMATAIAAAAADGCDVCSISWGTDEANWQARRPGGRHGPRRPTERGRQSGCGRRHDRVCGVRRQRFERRRPDARQRRSALVIPVRRRLRRHIEAARRR